MEWIILGIPMAILTCFTQKHSHSTTFWLSCLWCIVSLVLFNLDLCKSKLRIIVYSSNKTGWSSCTLTVTWEMNWKKKLFYYFIPSQLDNVETLHCMLHLKAIECKNVFAENCRKNSGKSFWGSESIFPAHFIVKHSCFF